MNGLVGGLFGKHYNADNGDEMTDLEFPKELLR